MGMRCEVERIMGINTSKGPTSGNDRPQEATELGAPMLQANLQKSSPLTSL